MRPQFTGVVMVLAGLCLAVTTARGQAPAYRAPRAGDGRPNLNGIWQALNTAHWDIEAGWLVLWLWSLAIASMISRGPAAYPILQPVIAKALLIPFTTTVLPWISGPREAMLVNRRPS